MNAKTKILVVDDSEITLDFLKGFFNEYGIEVLSSGDGSQGLELASRKRPDLIILDLVMPGMDGVEFLRRRKTTLGMMDIPVIVLSANTTRSNVLTVLEEGATRVIAKPPTREFLKMAINGVLRKECFDASSVSPEDKDLIKQKLIHLFVDHFSEKKSLIQAAVRGKDADSLKGLMHDIKGAGGTIGHPEISLLSGEVMNKGFKNSGDWAFAEFKCTQIFQIVQQIEKKCL